MITRSELESLFAAHGFADYKWMAPGDIVVDQWVRMKCMFGCDEYGRTATCPPNVPSVEECRRFFAEYSAGAIFHFEKKVDRPEDRHDWSAKVNEALFQLERSVFLAGYYKAFMLYMDSCCLCPDCPGRREECRYPESARPTAEAMAVDVFASVAKYKYPIRVLTDYSQPMHRYAFLLIE